MTIPSLAPSRASSSGEGADTVEAADLRLRGGIPVPRRIVARRPQMKFTAGVMEDGKWFETTEGTGHKRRSTVSLCQPVSPALS